MSVLRRLLAALITLRTVWRMASRSSVDDAPADVSTNGAGANGAGANGAGAAPDPDDPERRDVPADARAELWVALLLFASAACGLGFIALYVVEKHNTQLLGLAIGIALAMLAAAVILAGKLVVPQETSAEPRGPLLVPEKTEEVAELVHEGGDGISRRGLLTCAGCVAGGALAVAAATPLASLGPPPRSLHESPWRRGVRMVDESDEPLRADDIQIGTFYTALPEGESPESFGAGVLIVKLPASMIHLPPSRAGWAPQGLLGFSKICPHAGCAISLYRYPTYAASVQEQPAFTCPCHYSTFTPGDGGHVIFGPAGRSLPQLPVMIDAEGNLRAGGQFDEDIGPSWWGVRRA